MKINIIKQLTDEHSIINRIIDVLENILDSLEDGRNVAPELILADIHMLMEFSYQYHMWKYETILLPSLEELGKSKATSGIQSFLDQYKPGMEYINTINNLMETYDLNDSDNIDKIIKNGRLYIEQIHSIFTREEKEVINIIKESLDKDELSCIQEKIDDYEYSWDGPSLMNYQMMVRELERKAVMSEW